MDAVQTLFEDLRSPDLSIRFSVLSRIEGLEWTPEQIKALQGLFDLEADPGTRFHLQKILTRISGTKEKKAAAAVGPELEAILREPQRDDLGLAMLLEQVPRKEAPLIANQLRQARWPSFSPDVLPFVIAFFKRNGSFEDVAALENLCRHNNPRVLASAVEALEKLSPDSLKPLIVPLLLNPIHGIRSRAIRLLYRWDPREAIRHLEATLFSEEPAERSAALFHAFFFPFSDIEPLLRRFLSMEDNPELLQRAGLLFRANPMPEELNRLLEVMESSRGEKRSLIGELIKGVALSLHQAGLVSRKPEELLRELQEGYRKRKALELLERCRLALSGTDPEIRRKAVEKLGDLLRMGFTEAGNLLRQHLSGETGETLRTLINEALGPETLPSEPELLPPASPPAPPPISPPVSPPVSAPSPADKPTSVAPVRAPVPPAAAKPIPEKSANQDPMSLPGSGAPLPPKDGIFSQIERLRPQLALILTKWKGQEKILLIKSLARMGRKEDAQFLQPSLNESDPLVLSAVVEALSYLDPDLLFPYLPKLIQHSADEVRVVAIRAFSLFDKRQALSLVEKMLMAVQPRQRNLAIFCSAELDFPSVRHLLLKAFPREQDPDNIRQICAIFRNNPDEELYTQLIAFTGELDEPKREALKQLTTTMADQLIRQQETSHATVQALEASVRKRVAEEKESRLKAQPSYSLQNIQKIRKQQTSASSGSFSDPGLGRFAAMAFGTGAILTVLLWFFVVGPMAQEPTRIVIKKATGKDADKTVLIKGLVTGVAAAGQALYLQVEGETSPYYVQFRGSAPRPFQKGDRFQGQIRIMKVEGQTRVGEVVFSY